MQLHHLSCDGLVEKKKVFFFWLLLRCVLVVCGDGFPEETNGETSQDTTYRTRDIYGNRYRERERERENKRCIVVVVVGGGGGEREARHTQRMYLYHCSATSMEEGGDELEVVRGGGVSEACRHANPKVWLVFV